MFTARAVVVARKHVAVGLRTGDCLGRDVAAGAAAVLDDKALFETLLELGRDQPRNDVGEAASRECDQHGDILRRIGLRPGWLHRPCKNNGQRCRLDDRFENHERSPSNGAP
jgi:hypothetical protein